MPSCRHDIDEHRWYAIAAFGIRMGERCQALRRLAREGEVLRWRATLEEAAPEAVPAGAFSDLATPCIARGGFSVGPACLPLNEATGIQRPGRLAQAREQCKGQQRNKHTELHTSLHDPFLHVEHCRESPGRYHPLTIETTSTTRWCQLPGKGDRSVTALEKPAGAAQERCQALRSLR